MNDTTPDAIIQPARFQPTAVDEQRRWPISKSRLALVVTAAVVAWFLWFLFTAKSVRFDTDPPDALVELSGGFEVEFAGIRLLRRGAYRLRATAAGYYPLAAEVTVAEPRSQNFVHVLTPLPGRIAFTSEPPGATVFVGDARLGETPITSAVPAGSHAVTMTLPRYQDARRRLDVEGREVEQSMTAVLRPDWAEVTIPTIPPGATVRIDDDEIGITPGPVAIPSGEHRIDVKLGGYKAWRDILHVAAEQTLVLPPIELERADGLVTVRSSPRAAGITVNGTYRGTTPAEVSLMPGREHRIRVFKIGYAPGVRTVRVGSGEEATVSFELPALTGELAVTAEPADAELWIDGKRAGGANRTLTLAAVPHEVEVRKSGYAGYRRSVTPQPGFPQEIKVRLLTLEEARFARLKLRIVTALGQELLLMKPSPIRLGASRREPGRRANEVLRDVDLTRFYYLGAREVTNADFRKFASGHNSGTFETADLNEDEQPAANVSFAEAVLYCNWLSEREGLPLFYAVEFGKVVGFNPDALGYRLPTEAEWAWAARHVEDGAPLLRFPWGASLPPPDRHGNYADRAATHVVGRIIFGYNDNHIASAPAGTFRANAKDLHDLGGNVAEWVHDYYEIPEPDQTLNPLGPKEGDYHVIKGSSWMHGAISELRLAFRDYGAKGRPDVGFRLARFAE